MNHLLNKMEQKIGRYAIPNLILWLLVGYAIGYTFMYLAPDILTYMTLEPYYIMKGQVWRLITWRSEEHTSELQSPS